LGSFVGIGAREEVKESARHDVGFGIKPSSHIDGLGPANYRGGLGLDHCTGLAAAMDVSPLNSMRTAMEKRQPTSHMHLVVRHELVTHTATCNLRVPAFTESVAASLKPRSALVKLAQARVFAKLPLAPPVVSGYPKPAVQAHPLEEPGQDVY
jgi:hypothetical protein